MATGASTADVAILLVDARNGVRAQSRRHARIARLLGITDFVLADQQDGPGRLRPRRLRARSQDDFERVPHRRRGARHSDERAARRQRHHPQRAHAVVRRAAAARVPRDRAGAPQPAGGAVPLPGADGAAPRRRVPRLRRADRLGHGARPATGSRPGRPGRSARVKRIVTFDGDLDDGVRADVGDADARRRDRHQPRRRADASSRRSSASGSRPRSSGWTSGRSIRGASTC